MFINESAEKDQSFSSRQGFKFLLKPIGKNIFEQNIVYLLSLLVLDANE